MSKYTQTCSNIPKYIPICPKDNSNIVVDVNECLDDVTNVCEFGCINIEGSFYCDCDLGYTLDIDERTCNGNAICLQRLLMLLVLFM